MPFESIPALASESQALLIMSGICGILLLMVGGAVIRMGVALAGLVLGTLAGWIAWGSLEIPVPSWLMMALGAIVFLCFAFLLARFVTGLLLGIIVAGWLVAVVLTWSLFDPQIEAPIRPVPTWIASTLVQQDDLEEVSQDEIDSESAHAGVAMHDSLQRSWKEASELWSALPSIYRLMLGMAAASGLALGLLTALFLPRSALLLMTTGWGGLLLLISGIGLLGSDGRMDGPWQSSIAMLIAWTALSAIGWAVQRSLDTRDRIEAC